MQSEANTGAGAETLALTSNKNASTKAALIQRFGARDATVAVVGLGYVGLPLAVVFANAGFQVIGLDVDEQKVEAINRGESYIEDIPSERLAALVQAPSGTEKAVAATNGSGRRLFATIDFSTLSPPWPPAMPCQSVSRLRYPRPATPTSRTS